MPVYAKGKGKWRVRIYLGGKPKDWIIEGSKDDARDFEARKRLELSVDRPVERRTVPAFSEFCVETYAPEARRVLGKQTWRNRSYQVATLVEAFGEKKVSRISKADVEEFVAAQQRRGLGAVAINDLLKVFKTILNRAAAAKWLSELPEIKPLKVPKGRAKIRVWTEGQMRDLFKACEEEASFMIPVVVFLANTGCRKTEAIELRWDSVDFKRSTIWIEPNEEWTPKDNEAREVPMNSVLRPYLEILRAHRNALPKEERPDHVFTAPRTGRRWAVWPQNTFDRVRKKAGLVGGPHTLRHTYASHFLAAGGDLFTLARILGHSHERTTELYSHLLPSALSKAGDRVSFGPAPETLNY